MTRSRNAAITDVLSNDESVLYRAWVAHTTVHQPRCGEDCAARQVLYEALGEIRELLDRERANEGVRVSP